MRPNKDQTFANVGVNQDEWAFSLDANATAHLISVLTDIASDPIRYFVREYSTNALDSHIEAKTAAPFHVTLPTDAHPFFTVEDFGLGLSGDELRNVFSLYGRTTKDANDEVAGLLGLGSKSALTYSSTFNITATKGGVRTLVVVAKNEDGIGSPRVLDTVTTSAPNGVKIEIPIEWRDFAAVARAARDIYKYFPRGSVLLDGEEPEKIWDDLSLIWLDDDVAVSTDNQRSVIVQHNVAYPIPGHRIKGGYGIIGFVPSGTVNFTPSREELQFTPRTTETLDILGEYAEEALVRSVEAKLAESDPYERLRTLSYWRRYLPKIAQGHLKAIGTHVPLPYATWRYNPGAYSRGASKVASLAWFDLVNDTTLVTDYPNKGISQLNRARLDDQFARPVYLIPEGVDLSPLKGRDNIVSWDKVVANTGHVKIQRAYGSNGPTEYAVFHEGRQWSYTAKDLRECIAETTAPLLFEVQDDKSSYYSKWLKDCYVASIKPISVDKFQRLFPHARHANEVFNERFAAAKEALTDADRLKVSLTTLGTWTAFLGKEAEIADPELVQVLKIHRDDESVTLTAYRALGGSTYGLDDDVDNNLPLLDTRYPLISGDSHYEVSGNLPDAIIYINAKYSTLRKDQS